VRQFPQDLQPAAEQVVQVRRLSPGQDSDGGDLGGIIGGAGAEGPAPVVVAHLGVDHPVADPLAGHAV
jgi:hypothetical protein